MINSLIRHFVTPSPQNSFRAKDNIILIFFKLPLGIHEIGGLAPRFLENIDQREFVLLDEVEVNGGGEVIRTPDTRVANAMLCQLSYTPTPWDGGPQWIRTTDLVLIRDAL